jgi:hypothetical protein
MTPSEEIANYQTMHPNKNKAFYFSKAQIQALYDLSNLVDGVRGYMGQDTGGNFQLYLNACAGSVDFLPPGTSRTKALPCPTYCKLYGITTNKF